MDAFSLPLIIALTIGVVTFAVALMIARRSEESNTVALRLQRMAAAQDSDAATAAGREAAGGIGRDGEVSALAQAAETLMRKMGVDVESVRDRLTLRMAQAGIESPSATGNYLFAKYLGGPLLGLFGLVFILTPNPEMPELDILMGFIIVTIGFFGTDLFIRNRKDKRQDKLRKSFPDALDLLLVCVESGLALDAALVRVCREMSFAHPEMTKELNKTRLELTLLNDRLKALQNFAERTDLMPVRAFVSALIQSEQFGTPLAETLRVLAEEQRYSRLMIAENKANRLPVLITFPMTLLLLPAFIMVLISPAIIEAIAIYNS